MTSPVQSLFLLLTAVLLSNNHNNSCCIATSFHSRSSSAAFFGSVPAWRLSSSPTTMDDDDDDDDHNNILVSMRGGGGDNNTNDNTSTTSNNNRTGSILRIRSATGTIQRLIVDDAIQQLTIAELLDRLGVAVPAGATLALEDNRHHHNTTPMSTTTTEQHRLCDVPWKHGSVLSVQPQPHKGPRRPGKTTTTSTPRAFDPFPALRRDYARAVRQSRVVRSRTGGQTYASLAALREAMHTVEPQQDNRVQRLYMSEGAARDFHATTTTKTGLLLGTMGRERQHNDKAAARTSVSSTTDDEPYVTVAKVHAIVEPAAGDDNLLRALQDHSDDNGWKQIATALGLQPIGWIFLYNESSEKKNDTDTDATLPVQAQQAATACALQIELMQQQQQQQQQVPFQGFCTVAMMASTGATEAFQLSDVAVQMVAEGVWAASPATDDADGRYITTTQPVLVDGTETQELDSVLCLVNTALLRHEGWYSSSSSSDSRLKVSSKGRLTQAARKKLVKALEDDTETAAALPLLADFRVLLALQQLLLMNNDNNSKTDAKAVVTELCGLVRKWAQGQKKSTRIGTALAKRLKEVLLG